MSAKSAATGVDGKVSTREILNTDIMGIIKATVRKKWSSPEHQKNKLTEIKPEVDVWKFSFNKKRRRRTILSK